MPVLTICRGLPASGKTTWALEQVAARPGRVTRVNKDDLRAMLHAGRHTPANERLVEAARDAIVELALRAGQDVVVDDTNGDPRHEAILRALAAALAGATGDLVEVAVRTFDTPVGECIARDARRDNPVGREVILRMHRQHFAAPNGRLAGGQ